MSLKLQYVVAVAVVVWFVITMIGVHVDTKACEAAGGKRLRATFEQFKCYDVRSLKVLP